MMADACLGYLGYLVSIEQLEWYFFFFSIYFSIFFLHFLVPFFFLFFFESLVNLIATPLRLLFSRKNRADFFDDVGFHQSFVNNSESC
ncbi:uncharacterized protein SOCG_05108 [Schizosaccharomyces octosporus yFS286]|uniref:Uncharacterized protein n=1 Tax=Schizosaccharomyces octosporus (strain yFS286) TaxID=483514 RepID=S9PYG3_SCHOY|nr:uncharacterized protein SOCG_05108 [Schizosaccharomyces octosporus yFS286]EPX74106.1 hypothetical protein SOCG_05108 [Schizosaccharomyces octosporus yFS286]